MFYRVRLQRKVQSHKSPDQLQIFASMVETRSFRPTTTVFTFPHYNRRCRRTINIRIKKSHGGKVECHRLVVLPTLSSTVKAQRRRIHRNDESRRNRSALNVTVWHFFYCGPCQQLLTV